MKANFLLGLFAFVVILFVGVWLSLGVGIDLAIAAIGSIALMAVQSAIGFWQPSITRREQRSTDEADARRVPRMELKAQFKSRSEAQALGAFPEAQWNALVTVTNRDFTLLRCLMQCHQSVGPSFQNVQRKGR